MSLAGWGAFAGGMAHGLEAGDRIATSMQKRKQQGELYKRQIDYYDNLHKLLLGGDQAKEVMGRLQAQFSPPGAGTGPKAVPDYADFGGGLPAPSADVGQSELDYGSQY